MISEIPIYRCPLSPLDRKSEPKETDIKEIRIIGAARTVAASFLVVAMAAITGMSSTPANAQTVIRDINEFVDAQGTFDLGFLFVPPVKNFIGWCTSTGNRCASVDYAGLSEEPLGVNAVGTTFSGTVVEQKLPDGRAEVRVLLHTQNALTYGINGEGGVDFADSPLLFGHRVFDILAGQTPALGSSFLEVVFINTAPGAPLPDLLQLAIAPLEGQEFWSRTSSYNP